MNSINASYARPCGAQSLGALLIALVLVGTSQSADAALVQITLTGNQIISIYDPVEPEDFGDFTGDLDPDVTGDGIADITIVDPLLQPATPWGTYAEINGVEFETVGDPSAGAAYWIDGVLTGPIEGIIGETYFMPFSFTDTGFSAGSISAVLEIGVLAHFEEPSLTGTFLRRVLFDLDVHGTPTGYSEFTSYPEAQRQTVPEPASGAQLLMGLALVWRLRRR
jgi:hypothetical protein